LKIGPRTRSVPGVINEVQARNRQNASACILGGPLITGPYGVRRRAERRTAVGAFDARH